MDNTPQAAPMPLSAQNPVPMPLAQAQPAASAPEQLAMKDEYGNDTGIKLQIGASKPIEGDDPDGRKVLAARVTGWNTFELDGHPFEFQEGRALQLINRFPHFRKQLRDDIHGQDPA